MPTVAGATASAFQPAADRRDHQFRRTRAGVHVTDRALAEERRSAANRQHRNSRIRRLSGDHWQTDKQIGSARLHRELNRHQNVQHRLLPRLGFSPGLDRLHSARKGS